MIRRELRVQAGTVLVAALAALLLASSCRSGGAGADKLVPAAPCPRCNVVLISADTLRADHLGAYGYQRDTSPNIDAFAKRAWFFGDVTAQAPWTLPSHMSILTGLYSSRHGVRTKSQKLANETPTLASLLQGEGYATMAFTGGGPVSLVYNYHGFDRFDQSGGTTGRNFERMLAWLKEDARRPFFLFWHDFLVHCPYSPEKAYDLFSDASYSGFLEYEEDPGGTIKGVRPGEALKPIGWVKGCGGYFEKVVDQMKEADVELVKSKYDGEIRQLDARIGLILKTLEERGVAGETIVVFTSDHGESFAEREYRKKIGHHLMFEEVLHVPLVMRIPGGEPRRVEERVESVDIMPTVLSALGIAAPADLDGRDLAATTVESARARPAYSEHFVVRREYSLKYDGYKLIQATEGRWPLRELYDLRRDPLERENIAGRGGEVEAQLSKWMETRMAHTAVPAPRAILDDATKEQLRALGYRAD